MTTTTLTPLAREAAERITDVTWTQREMDGPGGVHCAHGWVMACARQPGDAQLVRAAMRHRGMDEHWNDAPERTAAEVRVALLDLDVDAALADLWGERAPAVIRLVRQVDSLTGEQARYLATAWDGAGAALATAWYVAGAATRKATRKAARYAQDAALAVAVAPLVGRRGLTQEHVDTLLAPWASVMGDPR